MRNTNVSTLVQRVLPLALCVSCWCLRASAETPEGAAPGAEVARAEQYAAQAFEAYRQKDYPSAVALYHKALEIAASADLLYNIARIYDTGLRDRALAVNFYRRYVADPGAVPERIEKANRRLEALRAAQQAVLASTSPEPSLPAERAAATSAAAAGEAERESYWSAFRIAGLASGVAGLAALGVGTGYGLSALSEAETAHAECDGNQCRSQRGVDAAEVARQHASVATLAIGAGGVLLAAGAALWFFSPQSYEEAGVQAGVRWVPVASSAQLGLQLSGGW